METQKKASSSTTHQLLSPTASQQQLSSVAPADKPLAPAEQQGVEPVSAREGVEKKRKFEICVQKKQPVAKKIPKVSQLCTKPEPPPPIVRAKLGSAPWVMGIDIKTSDYDPGKRPLTKGQFGHWTFCSTQEVKFKIVQLGWAIGPATEGSEVKEKEEILIRPEGCTISSHATEKHGITNEKAQVEGVRHGEALRHFMSAVNRVRESGGCVVAHHLGFFAAVIDEHLKEAELEEWREQWKLIATQGVCTMDVDIWDWANKHFGRERGQGEKTLVMGLKGTVDLLLPRSAEAKSLWQQRPAADVDAQLYRLVYNALRGLVEKASL